jgi:Fe2+ transport system protein B
MKINRNILNKVLGIGIIVLIFWLWFYIWFFIKELLEKALK